MQGVPVRAALPCAPMRVRTGLGACQPAARSVMHERRLPHPLGGWGTTVMLPLRSITAYLIWSNRSSPCNAGLMNRCNNAGYTKYSTVCCSG